MNRKNAAPIPEPIEQLQRQLDQFRSTRSQRTKLPESLWQAAVELARQHGVHSVAQPLRLDYMGLKKRLGDVATPGPKKTTKPASFVELMPHPATVQEWVIEFEASGGSKMRVQWKSAGQPDWGSLLRAWRETER
jgi:hypothetical protein